MFQYLKRVKRVFLAFKYLFLSLMSSWVRRSCATFIPYLLKAFSYAHISLHCPVAAAACLFGIPSTLPEILSSILPAAIAPDVTITNSYLFFLSFEISFA